MRISTKRGAEPSREDKSEREREVERERGNDDKRYILCEESIQ